MPCSLKTLPTRGRRPSRILRCGVRAESVTGGDFVFDGMLPQYHTDAWDFRTIGVEIRLIKRTRDNGRVSGGSWPLSSKSTPSTKSALRFGRGYPVLARRVSSREPNNDHPGRASYGRSFWPPVRRTAARPIGHPNAGISGDRAQCLGYRALPFSTSTFEAVASMTAIHGPAEAHRRIFNRTLITQLSWSRTSFVGAPSPFRQSRLAPQAVIRLNIRNLGTHAVARTLGGCALLCSPGSGYSG